jgi:hypothetical protein
MFNQGVSDCTAGVGWICHWQKCYEGDNINDTLGIILKPTEEFQSLVMNKSLSLGALYFCD